MEKQKPATVFLATAAGSRNFGCDSCLLSSRFDLPDHNPERAAPMPVMMGMMVCAVRVMCSLEAHKNRLVFLS